nr:MAG TPA_asm: hypothetical protein [Caudoviricetes sp.]
MKNSRCLSVCGIKLLNLQPLRQNSHNRLLSLQ